MRRSSLLATVAGALCATAVVATRPVQATVLYDTTGGVQHTNAFGPAPMLDDVGIASGPATITAMNFGFRNTSTDPESVEAVVTFWDSMNTAATGTTVVNGTSLGSFRVAVGGIAGSATGTTGLFNLATPISVPDTSFGVQIDFVFTGTDDASDVDALLSKDLPTVGTTADRFWSDDGDGVFRGNDAIIFNPGNPTTHANFYMRIDGVVPEPGSAGVAGVALVSLAAGRRRRA